MIYRTKFYDQHLSHNDVVQTTTLATRDITNYSLLGVANCKVRNDEVSVISWPIRQQRVQQGDLRSVLQGPEIAQLTGVPVNRDTSVAVITAFATTASACQVAAHFVFPALAPLTFGLGCLASVVAGMGQNERSTEAVEKRREILADVAMAGIQHRHRHA